MCRISQLHRSVSTSCLISSESKRHKNSITFFYNHTLIPNSNLQCIYDIFIFVAQVENCFTEINFPAGFFTVMQLHTLKRRLLTGST